MSRGPCKWRSVKFQFPPRTIPVEFRDLRTGGDSR